EREGAERSSELRPRERTDGQCRFRGAPAARPERLVVVAAGPACAPPSLDDRRLRRSLAATLPETLRPPGACDARHARRGGGVGGRVPALAPRALPARHRPPDPPGSRPPPHVPP